VNNNNKKMKKIKELKGEHGYLSERNATNTTTSKKMKEE